MPRRAWRSIQRPTKCEPMAVFSLANRRPCFRWHSAISCTDMATEITADRDARQRVVLHRRAGKWPDELAVGSFTLDYDDRYRRRISLVTDQGDEVLLHLNTATAMRDGDGLQIEDGRWFVVRAAAESVVDVSHSDVSQLVRLAWHLGNRHILTEFRSQALRIRPDHVIEDMLRGCRRSSSSCKRPFSPKAAPTAVVNMVTIMAPVITIKGNESGVVAPRSLLRL